MIWLKRGCLSGKPINRYLPLSILETLTIKGWKRIAKRGN
jgi:hypothetical protein